MSNTWAYWTKENLDNTPVEWYGDKQTLDHSDKSDKDDIPDRTADILNNG
jgi:hypothetical protein